MAYKLPFDLVATRSEIEELRMVEKDLSLAMTELAAETAKNKALDREIIEHRDLNNSLKQNMEILQEKVSQLTAENAALTAENTSIPTLMDEVGSKNKDLESLFTKISTMEAEIQTLSTEAVSSQAQHRRDVHNLEQENDVLQKALSECRKQLSEHQQSINNNMALRQAAQTELSKQTQRNHKLEQQLTEQQSELTKKQQDLTTECEKHESQTADLKKKLTEQEESLQNKQSEIRTLQTNLLNQVNECRDLMFKLQRKEQELQDASLQSKNNALDTEEELIQKITALAQDNERLTKQVSANANLLPKIAEMESRLEELSSNANNKSNTQEESQRALLDYISDLEHKVVVSNHNEATQAEKCHQIASKIADLENKFSQVGFDPSKYHDLKTELAASHMRESELKEELLEERKRSMAVAMSGPGREFVSEIEELRHQLSQSRGREEDLKEQLLRERQRLLSITASVTNSSLRGSVSVGNPPDRFQTPFRRQVVSPGRPKRAPVMSPPLSPDLHSCASSPPMSPLSATHNGEFNNRRNFSPYRKVS